MFKTRPAVRSLVIPLIASALLVVGCNRALNPTDARAVIESSPLIRATDNVSVEAISEVGPAESIVRATIAARTLNLKFRRFDTGWTWEFVETKAGGWIAPDVAIGQIREELRQAAATKWATEHVAEYTPTANKVYLVSIYYSYNPRQLEDIDMWIKLRKGLIDMFKKRPDGQDRVEVLTNDHPPDAWGTPIETRFDSKAGSFAFVSAGADKMADTGDDVVCLVTFRRGYEDGRVVWVQERTWTLPEGLGGTVAEFFDKEDDKIEYSQAVKP